DARARPTHLWQRSGRRREASAPLPPLGQPPPRRARAPRAAPAASTRPVPKARANPRDRGRAPAPADRSARPDRLSRRRRAAQRYGELRAERAEEPREIFDGALELAWLEPLDASVGRLGHRLELRRDADVAGV